MQRLTGWRANPPSTRFSNYHLHCLMVFPGMPLRLAAVPRLCPKLKDVQKQGSVRGRNIYFHGHSSALTGQLIGCGVSLDAAIAFCCGAIPTPPSTETLPTLGP